MKIKRILPFLLLFIFVILPFKVEAQDNSVCATYITQVGCTHCAKTDPVVLDEAFENNPNFYVIEYELFKDQINAPFVMDFNNHYGSPLGVPTLIFGGDDFLVGDRDILNNINKNIDQKVNNKCPLKTGETISLNKLDFNLLAGKPKIWHGNKILVKQKGETDNDFLHQLLETNKPEELLKDNDLILIQPKKIAISGDYIEFNKAANVDGWLFQWRTGGSNPGSTSEVANENDSSLVGSNNQENNSDGVDNNQKKEKSLTIAKVLSLGAVDAINPCALAVLILMMITIVTYNAKDKRKLLLAGLGFILAVFVTYIIYGIIIVKFFQVVQALSSVRIWLYRILGVIAIILGVLNIRDFFHYTPGSFGTEMPMFLRPKVKKIISGVTSPIGAMGTGFFVTIFLLPCTIGPYVIAGGILSVLEMIEVIPWLLLYNFIFVLPMLVIVFLIYGGMSHIKDVQKWKDKNIKYLHLIAGLIMALLGIAMLFGLI